MFLRGRFERGLLKWFRNARDPVGPQEMRDAVAGIEALQGVPTSRAFWYAATAFFDALGHRETPSDPATKRLCGRIDAQMRRVMEGSSIVAERLMRDVLYHVATTSAQSSTICAVRETYGLARLLPASNRRISDTPLAPMLRKFREGLGDARDAWTQFSKGGAIGLPRFQEAISPLAEQAREAEAFLAGGTARRSRASAGISAGSQSSAFACSSAVLSLGSFIDVASMIRVQCPPCGEPLNLSRRSDRRGWVRSAERHMGHASHTDDRVECAGRIASCPMTSNRRQNHK